MLKRLLFTALFAVLLMTSYAQTDKEAAVYSTKEGAIKGYDPVAYFTEGKAVKGDMELVLEWAGAKWHFVSQENKKLFEATPEKYAPQYGGWCAWGWSNGYPAKSEPDAWKIVDGKLYLNYNRQIQKKWVANQYELIEKADKSYSASFH